MTTEVENVSEDTAASVTVSSEHVTTNLVEYRTYGAFDNEQHLTGVKKVNKKNEDGTVSVITEFSGNPAVLSQTQTGKNWTKAEEAGATILNRNQYKFYTLADEAGFATLVPDPTQRLYLIQKGIDAIQTAAANAYQTELEDKKGVKEAPDVLVHSEETIDLLADINEPPQKKNLTPMEKFARAIPALDKNNLDQAIAMLEQLIRAKAAEQSV